MIKIEMDVRAAAAVRENSLVKLRSILMILNVVHNVWLRSVMSSIKLMNKSRNKSTK